MYIDEAGFPRAELPLAPLALFLEHDVQNNADFCRELLQAVEDVQFGMIPEWGITGNAHTLKLTPAGARITNLYASNQVPFELPLAEFRQTLLAWSRLIASGQARSGS